MLISRTIPRVGLDFISNWFEPLSKMLTAKVSVPVGVIRAWCWNQKKVLREKYIRRAHRHTQPESVPVPHVKGGATTAETPQDLARSRVDVPERRRATARKQVVALAIQLGPEE